MSLCTPERTDSWGKECGNLRVSKSYKFTEVKIRSINGYEIPGWMIRSAENGKGPAKGVVIFVPGGGSDRRENSRYIPYFINRAFDVLSVDLGCAGESPCPVPGLTFGHRESRDVASAYLYLVAAGYPRIYAMGTSVGATSILVALPSMPRLAGVIAENPMYNFERFVMETPAAPRIIPGWFKSLVLRLALRRGRFDGLATAENSLRVVQTVPVFFIHSINDKLIPYKHSEELHALYKGPKKLWISEKGEHARIWNADPQVYEAKLNEFLGR